jgi:hypothetical protein
MTAIAWKLLVTKFLAGLDCAAYMDDCGIWTDELFEEHMELLGKILQQLADNGLKCNLLKCDWAVQETNFLGYWMTPNNINSFPVIRKFTSRKHAIKKKSLQYQMKMKDSPNCVKLQQHEDSNQGPPIRTSPM